MKVVPVKTPARIYNLNGLKSKDFVTRRRIVEVSKGSKETRGLKPNKRFSRTMPFVWTTVSAIKYISWNGK